MHTLEQILVGSNTQPPTPHLAPHKLSVFLEHKGDGLISLLYIVAMSRPAEVRGNVHSEELKRFHRFNNRTSYRYWLTVATIIMQKINPHQLALTRVQLHVVTMSEAVNVIYKVFHYRRRVGRNYLQYSANLNPSRLYALILSTSSHASEPWFSLLETSQS